MKSKIAVRVRAVLMVVIVTSGLSAAMPVRGQNTTESSYRDEYGSSFVGNIFSLIGNWLGNNRPSYSSSSGSSSSSSADLNFTRVMNEIAGLAQQFTEALGAQQTAQLNAMKEQAQIALSQADQQLAGATEMLTGAFAGFATSLAFAAHGAMSCPVFKGGGTLLGEDDCGWVKLTSQRTRQFGITTDSTGFRIGGQKEITAGWFVGATLHEDTSWMQAGSVGNNGQSFDAGVTVKHLLGPWLFASALTIGTNVTHTTRPALSGGTMQSNADTWGGGVKLRGAYDFSFTGWYARPRLDLDAYYVSLAAFQEYGPDPVGLAVGGSQKLSTSISPALEIGGRVDIGGAILRPYVTVGAMFLPDNSRTVILSFTGVDAQFGSAATVIAGPSVLGTFEAGLQLYQAHGLEVKAEYGLQSGNDYLGQSVSLRGAYHF